MTSVTSQILSLLEATSGPVDLLGSISLDGKIKAVKVSSLGKETHDDLGFPKGDPRWRYSAESQRVYWWEDSWGGDTFQRVGPPQQFKDLVAEYLAARSLEIRGQVLINRYNWSRSHGGRRM